MIVDTEIHLVEHHGPMQEEKGAEMVEPWTWHEMSGDLIIAEMNHAGVDKGFIVGHGDAAATRPYDFRFFRKYKDRFCWFPNILNPRGDGCLERIREDFELGAR